MEPEPFVVASSEQGRVTVSHDAVVQLVRHAVEESYGVVALGRGRTSRLVPWGSGRGIDVELRDEGLAIDIRIVVEHGLKLAEVSAAVRERVEYELERMVGLPLAALEIRIDRVRTS